MRNWLGERGPNSPSEVFGSGGGGPSEGMAHLPVGPWGNGDAAAGEGDVGGGEELGLVQLPEAHR